MEKVAFIIDGGYFVKKYKDLKHKFPSADDVEIYVLNILKFLRKRQPNHLIDIYRIFYYDCPPLYNLSKLPKFANKPKELSNQIFQKICNDFEKAYRNIKTFHAQMKRKNFFALRMGELKLQGWEQNKKKNRWWLKTQQKGVDMKIGLDIANITGKKLCSKIILISGDTDMIPAMKMARKEGVHVYWHSMDDSKHGSNLNIATHSDVVITNKWLESL